MNLPYWVILILLLIAIVLYFIIPWKKIRDAKSKKSKKVNEPKELNESNTDKNENIEVTNEQKPIMGIFNGFGNKQALRNKVLVYVKEEKSSCDLCIPFEGKVISLEKFDTDYITMSEAISKGYHHIGCKHIDINYYPNKTLIPESKYKKFDKQKHHNKVLELFKLEQEIRNLKYRIENEQSTDTLKDELKLKIKKLKDFCKANSIKHDSSRLNPYLPDNIKFSSDNLF
ncbi:hypothetical protein [Spiroplasma turonicum]|uniref:Transmembrane protein n=1 Tax=Spiroplasma turonicum TaxID=216946 RepID=A0A0K1P8D2_9MOLU|nr:hypothetical protein [Spiroplasma turonicum]AKU80157.1 hypothetical protein STURON_00911 [Spiroplasma turonicum]ALX71157.1 hypothetical protein STURO_v1c09060 [Spiroplasma turonicum]